MARSTRRHGSGASCSPVVRARGGWRTRRSGRAGRRNRRRQRRALRTWPLAHDADRASGHDRAAARRLAGPCWRTVMTEPRASSTASPTLSAVRRARPSARPEHVGAADGILATSTDADLDRRCAGHRTYGRAAVAAVGAPPTVLPGRPTPTEEEPAMGNAIRIEDDGAVRHLVLCRPDEMNTITVELRDELGAALDAADSDNGVRVVLVRAEGRAFCAGFGLDWSTVAQAEPGRRTRAGVGQRRRRPDDRHLRQHLRQAPLDLEADARGRAGVVHRRRHRHDPQRRPHRRRRVGPLRLPAGSGVGRAGSALGVGRAARARARQALPLHRRRAHRHARRPTPG